MDQSSAQPTDAPTARDAAYWASPVKGLTVAETLSAGAPNLNVEARRVVGTLQGFGQLWQKTYRVRLAGVTVSPAEVVKTWKDEFPSFWPRGSHF